MPQPKRRRRPQANAYASLRVSPGNPSGFATHIGLACPIARPNRMPLCSALLLRRIVVEGRRIWEVFIRTIVSDARIGGPLGAATPAGTDRLRRTPAGFTTPALDGSGLRDHTLARPAG